MPAMSPAPKPAVAALGYDPARLDVLLYQLVTIVKDGEVVMSSKRKGNILELKADLIDEIGKDAARFFFLMRSPHSALEIDINLARKTEKDNPVYYVQYAHARIVQAIEKAREEKGVAVPAAVRRRPVPADRGDRDRSDQETERTARRDRPGRLRNTPRSGSSSTPATWPPIFHTFYDAGNRNPALRVVCDDPEMLKARLGSGPRRPDRPSQRPDPARPVRPGADVMWN